MCLSAIGELEREGGCCPFREGCDRAFPGPLSGGRGMGWKRQCNEFPAHAAERCLWSQPGEQHLHPADTNWFPWQVRLLGKSAKWLGRAPVSEPPQMGPTEGRGAKNQPQAPGFPFSGLSPLNHCTVSVYTASKAPSVRGPTNTDSITCGVSSMSHTKLGGFKNQLKAA